MKWSYNIYVSCTDDYGKFAESSGKTQYLNNLENYEEAFFLLFLTDKNIVDNIQTQ